MFATQILPEDKSESDAEDGIVSEIVGVIIIEDKKYVVRRGENKIGRDSTLCSIVINNCTVSKVHATIESEGVDDTFIYDVNSTNQTKLGKKALKPHCRYKLDHESKLTFGNVSAKFLFPYVSRNTNLVKLSSLDEVRDIFNAATQVCIPDTSISSGSVFKKLGVKSHAFKIPSSLSAKVKESGKNEVTYCKSDSSKTKPVTEFHVPQNTNIFSLNTQCQLYEPSAADVKTEVKTVPSDDNHNSLLNDGQDDVLCNFMNLNFPKEEEESFKKIITKTETEDSSQVLNISTQTKKLGEKIEVKQEKQVFKESNRSCKPGITSTTLSCKFTSSQSKNNNTQIFEENDFIKTQEFNSDATKNIKQENTQSKNTETQSHLEDTLYNFFKEQTNEDLILTQAYENFEKSYQKMHDLSRKQINEDLILTQDFENFEKSYQKMHDLSRKQINEDLILTQDYENFEKRLQEKAVPDLIPQFRDFMKTQMYDVEKEAKRDIFTNIEIIKKNDTKYHFEESLDFLQRNRQKDVIESRVFESNVRNEGILSSSDDDDDNFIDSQPVEMCANKTQNHLPKTLSRESSPDLLCSEGTYRNSQDNIFTRIFDIPECQNQTFSKKIESSHLNKQNECIFKQSIVLESSDDETESDLENLSEADEANKDKKSFKTEWLFKNSIQSKNLPPQEDNSSSYIFDFGPENHLQQIKTAIKQKRPTYLSDSDATDCEEISSFSSKILIKQERLKNIKFEETEALNVTLPDNFAEKNCDSKDSWMSGKGSPIFIINNDFWNPLSLKSSSTQDIVSGLNKNLVNEHDQRKDSQMASKMQKTEVKTKNSDELILSKLAPGDSPLKRPLDSNSTEEVLFKKSKTEGLLQNTEKQFLRLVQNHDIAQIQPSRTRNSLKTPIKRMAENNQNRNNISLRFNNTNEHPRSRRKSTPKTESVKKGNGDITLYLKTKKETRKSFGEK